MLLVNGDILCQSSVLNKAAIGKAFWDTKVHEVYSLCTSSRPKVLDVSISVSFNFL